MSTSQNSLPAHDEMVAECSKEIEPLTAGQSSFSGDPKITSDQANIDANELNLRRHLMVYDGHCNFCKSQIAIMRFLDFGKQLQFESLHDPIVKSVLPDLSHEQLMEQIWIKTTDGLVAGGAEGIKILSRRIPSLWPLMPLLHVPFSLLIWQKIYRFIARNRYRIAGKTCESDQCSIHFDKR